uniref:Uncharacterized protein n=1 Tax=Rhizophora mucronata TaxID=61149 RepID=A0A2P2QFV7_RHIMU
MVMLIITITVPYIFRPPNRMLTKLQRNVFSPILSMGNSNHLKYWSLGFP